MPFTKVASSEIACIQRVLCRTVTIGGLSMPNPNHSKTQSTPDTSKKFPSFARSYFSRILLSSFVFSIAINILMLAMPIYSLQVFSRAIPSGNYDTLAMLTLVVVIALSLSAGLEMVRSRLLARAGNALEVAWRRRLTAEALDSAAGPPGFGAVERSDGGEGRPLAPQPASADGSALGTALCAGHLCDPPDAGGASRRLDAADDADGLDRPRRRQEPCRGRPAALGPRPKAVRRPADQIRHGARPAHGRVGARHRVA